MTTTTSDAAVSQSVAKVKRCEYRHQWAVGNPATETYTCTVCNYQPKQDSEAWHEAQAVLHLRGLLKPGDTVYTVLRHVSRSGMSRNIDLYAMKGGEPIWISAYVGHAIGSPQSRKNWERSQGLTVGGCGMDMGFHLVESLSMSIYPTYQCLGEDGKCPSNYHVNYRRRVRCDGVGTGDDWTPCFRSDTLHLPNVELAVEGEEPITMPGRLASVIRTPRYGDDAVETICPTCKGEGYYDNPNGPERWDLLHHDGYALNHKWL